MGIKSKGEVRSPVTWAILSLCCGLGSFILMLFKWPGEFNKALGEEKYAWWNFLIPIYNIIQIFFMCQDLDKLQDMANLKDKTGGIIVFILFLVIGPVGVYMMQNTLNKVWEA